MASNKVEMSLDDIIKKDRKNGGAKQQRGKKAGVNARKGKPGQTQIGKKKSNVGGQKPANTAATKRLVQQLVKKALAQNTGRNGGAAKGRVVKKVIRGGGKQFRGVSQRSQVIKKGPRTETVIVRKFVQPRPQPRQQIVREVIVQEPVRQRVISQPVRRFNNRTKVVYVQKQGPQRRSFGGSFQQRPRFQQQQRRDFDPFYQPANYLQRI